MKKKVSNKPVRVLKLQDRVESGRVKAKNTEYRVEFEYFLKTIITTYFSKHFSKTKVHAKFLDGLILSDWIHILNIYLDKLNK